MGPSAPWRPVLALAGAFALGGCGLFGGEEEANPPAELVRFEAALDIDRLWSAGVGDGSKSLRLGLRPVSDGSRIFAATHDGRVAAYEAESGRRLWVSRTKLPLAGGPAVDGDLVVAGSSDGDLVALAAETGAILWQTRVSSEVLTAPAFTPRLVLVRTVDGRLLALDRERGTEAWFAQQSMPRLSVRGTGRPVVAGMLVVCGFDNGRVAAYDLRDGTLVWETLANPPTGRTEVERLSDINSAVEVVGDDVYVAGYHGSVMAMALESGQLLWAREVSSYGGIAADFVNVYVTAENGELVAISRRGGREVWQNDTLRNRGVTGPAAIGRSLVVGDFEGYVHWFDAATGELQARSRAGGQAIVAPPLPVGENVYVQTEGGNLYAFRAAAR